MAIMEMTAGSTHIPAALRIRIEVQNMVLRFLQGTLLGLD